MNFKKLQRKIEKYGIKCYNEGYEAGENDTREEVYAEGAQDEQDRIQAVLDMHLEWALESGKGSEVVMLNRMKEILKPIEVDYSIETYTENLRKDGF